jgi:hypothetical protein
MSQRIAVRALAFLLTVNVSVRAQTIRGRVVMPDSVTPAAGVVITAIAENGKGAGSALSNSAGDYSMRVVAPGRYQLRALQIGFRPTVVQGVDVAANGVRVQNVVLGRQPVNLTAMLVRDEGCGISQRDGDTFLQLWEQARAALSATRLSEQSGALDVQLVRIAGHVDAMGYYRVTAPSRYPILPHAAIDSANARDVMVDAVIATTAAETLATAGYIRRHDSASVIFDIPSAEALLSDDFAAKHCFGIAKPPDEHPEWIGVRFAPRQKRGDVIDVRGVLWLDRNSAELRRLEFTYANLPRTSYEACDDAPENIPIAERKPICQSVRDDDANRLGLGGDADFQRLTTGEWLVTQWSLRKPPDEAKFRKTIRCLRQRRSCEPCYYGPDCMDIWWFWPRLVTTAGTLSRVTRGETELYRNDSSLALIDRIATRRAGGRPANIEGRITSADGRPLTSAIIQTDDPARVGRTDSSGVFRIRALPPGPIGVLVRCRGYEPVQFRLPLLPDSTRRLSLALTTDGNASGASSSCAEKP